MNFYITPINGLINGFHWVFFHPEISGVMTQPVFQVNFFSRCCTPTMPRTKGRKSWDSWMYPYHPQESLENTINTMGTLLGVHPIVPWEILLAMKKPVLAPEDRRTFRNCMLADHEWPFCLNVHSCGWKGSRWRAQHFVWRGTSFWSWN